MRKASRKHQDAIICLTQVLQDWRQLATGTGSGLPLFFLYTYAVVSAAQLGLSLLAPAAVAPSLAQGRALAQVKLFCAARAVSNAAAVASQPVSSIIRIQCIGCTDDGCVCRP